MIKEIVDIDEEKLNVILRNVNNIKSFILKDKEVKEDCKAEIQINCLLEHMRSNDLVIDQIINVVNDINKLLINERGLDECQR